MKLLRIGEFAQMKNPTNGRYKLETLTSVDSAENFGGHFGILPPGDEAPYHYHEHRESIIVPVSGESIEIVEGKEFLIKPGDVLFIPAGEKHGAVNRSNQEFRFLEFFTPPARDIVEV